jgi:putative CocE/NonD family hydrolase
VNLRIERDVPVPMRDGTILYADLYRPVDEGRYPVLLQRTPYSKSTVAEPIVPPIGPVLFDAVRAASNGYVVVIQDERGRYTSEGEFRIFLDAPNDGYDTVEWCAAQPWSNGRVGMYGISYTAVLQWLTAMTAPPSLACIFPGMSAANLWEAWTYHGGAFELAFNKSWAMTFLSLGTLPRLDPDVARAAGERIAQGIEDMAAVFERLPVSEFPEVEGIFPSYDDWAQHPSYDDYWQQLDAERHFEKIAIPVHHMSGWYDTFLGGVLRSFAGMSERAPSEVREQQRLLIGPWIHWAPPFPSRSGDVEFGARANVDWDSIQLRWFDHWLKDIDTGLMDEPPVRIFVMGENVWRDEHEWPLRRTEWTKFFLHSDGGANTKHGDGRLSTEPPGDEQADRFLYDPLDPTPTRGGNLCCWPVDTPAGAFDQGLVEERRDVLVYTTYQLDRPIEVTGPVTVTLYASTSAPDTDFTAKLVDVHPDGFAQNLCDGIVRARYRESKTTPSLIDPGRVYEYTIDLWATSNVFKPGHSIRLEIASANFPKFDRNLNTGEGTLTSLERTVATQHVFHTAENASHVLLPIIPR